MKKFWKIFPALILIAGLVMFIGCKDPDPDDNVPPPGTFTWTLSADGAGVDGVGTVDTTKITITFNVNVLSLRGQNITLEGPAEISGLDKGAGNAWDVAVTPTGSGSVSVTINATNIEPGPKQVQVWKTGSVSTIGYTAGADGTTDTTTSTKITLTFSEAVTGLSADDITITAVAGATGGAATKNTLSGSGTTYELAILVSKQGKVNVTIAKDGIDASARQIDVYMIKEEGPPAIPEDGQIATLKWKRLEIDQSIYDPEDDAADIALGKGVITGADFDAIVEATGYQGTYLRIFLDLTNPESGTGVGWGVGALGNLSKNSEGFPDGGSNLIYNAPVINDYGYVDVQLKALKGYYDVADEEIFVNVWRDVKVRAILLYEPIPAVPESSLPAGVIELSLPEADGIVGKGSLGSVDVTAINNAESGYFLELYVVGSTQGSEGWGIGAIGPSWTDTECVAIASQGLGDFVVIIQIDDLRAKYTGGTIDTVIINLYDCEGLSKIWLRAPGTITELTLPSGDDPPGKGSLGSPDVTKINAAASGSFLKLYVVGSTQENEGWGIGAIGPSWTDTECVAIASQGLGDFVVTIQIDELRAKYTGGTIDTVIINLWACEGLSKLELVEP